MFSKISEKISEERYLTLLWLVIIAVVSISLAWFLSGMVFAGLIFLAVVVPMAIAQSIWTVDKFFRLRVATLGIVSLVTISGNNSFWQKVLQNFIQSSFSITIPDNTLSPVLLFFLWAILVTVFYFTQEKQTILGKPELPLHKIISEPNFEARWKQVCEALETHIRDIDRDTNWSSEYYTPLEAEVEIKTSTGKQKIVGDLLKAIKTSNDRLFLLIGDPGSGKSVAMRKLCLEILQEEKLLSEKRIPIYVNLKEWVMKTDWKKEKPTVKDLEAFVKNTLRKERFIKDFFDKHFDVLNENGYLFFVLDSFDEIPQILGVAAGSKLIDHLTEVCRDFLRGAKDARSKGILSSREFRMPRENYFEAKTFLRIRPFTIEKIQQTLTQSGRISNEVINDLFKKHTHLITILRNPFITSLLYEYLINNDFKFPENQASLFKNYIEKSIIKAKSQLDLDQIEYAEIQPLTIQIADIIFGEQGLQASISYLKQRITNIHFESIVQILRTAHIARGDKPSEFSFAHRRFYEYFVVFKLLELGKNAISLENIPTDSRWRDTLVLYCEVAPLEESVRIADYCWYQEIKPANNINASRSKHSLRFLAEAYKSVKPALKKFEQELAELLIEEIIKKNEDQVNVKIAVEALGILKDENLKNGTQAALNLHNSWINETALRGCRHLDSIDKTLEQQLMTSIDPDPENIFAFEQHIVMPDKELAFSLRLSEAFKEPEILYRWRPKKQMIIAAMVFNFLCWIVLYTQYNIFSTDLSFFGGCFTIISFALCFGVVQFTIAYCFRKIHFKSSKYLEQRLKPLNNILNLTKDGIKLLGMGAALLIGAALVFLFVGWLFKELLVPFWVNSVTPFWVNSVMPFVESSISEPVKNGTGHSLGDIIITVILIGFAITAVFYLVHRLKSVDGKIEEEEDGRNPSPRPTAPKPKPTPTPIPTPTSQVEVKRVPITIEDVKATLMDIGLWLLLGSLAGFVIWIIYMGWLLYFVISVILIGICLFLWDQYSAWKLETTQFQLIKKKIQSNRSADRSEIEKVISDYWDDYSRANEYLNFLETHAKQVTGKWSTGFLRADANPIKTRLAQLDERWREAEEREAEANNF
jgi:NACHT domain